MRVLEMQVVVMAMAVLGAVTLASAGSVQVPRSIGFSEGAEVRPNVKDECKLQTKVPHFVDEFSSDVQLADGEAGGGRVLSMRITDVHAPGGGMFSGPKWMTVKGELTEGGTTIGSFTARRGSGGGAFGGYKGTCSILGRCAKAIGKDIAGWLQNPTNDARLGDAR